VGTLDDGGRTPLGIVEGDGTVAETAFEPGDRLLLYTDGVTEARDPPACSSALTGWWRWWKSVPTWTFRPPRRCVAWRML
jgi:hypothetical protein